MHFGKHDNAEKHGGWFELQVSLFEALRQGSVCVLKWERLQLD
jgi:hypothetical protein